MLDKEKFRESNSPIGLSEMLELFEGNIPKEVIELFTDSICDDSNSVIRSKILQIRLGATPIV